MENARADTVNKLRSAADAAFAMLAGMQLELFTPLKAGPKTAEDIAHAIGVGPARLRLLLYSLVAAGLLTEEHGYFSNSPEADQCLVRGGSSYIGNWHAISKLPNLSAPGCHRLKSTSPILRKRN